MIQIKAVGSESWLSRRAASRLSSILGRRLWERCEGRRGLFVTLTYARDEYPEGSRELYRQQADRQDVPLFLRKVGRYLDRSLKGLWFCKLEFQKGGWVHWHLIILDVGKIPHRVLKDLWGHGHVWLQRINKRNCRYCTKYTAKADALPAWLYLERPRSVKIVRVSHGFWGAVEGTEEDGGDLGESVGTIVPSCVSTRLVGCYEPIGESLSRASDRYIVRDDRGYYRRGSADLATLLLALLRRGCGLVGQRGGWLQVDGTLRDVEVAAASAERAEGPPAPPLHSKETGNRDVASWCPGWLDEWFRERALEGSVS